MVNNVLETAEGRTYSTAIKCGLYIVFKHFVFSFARKKKKKKKTQILEPENNPISLLHSPVSQAQGFIGVLSVMGFGHVSADEMR